LAWTLLEFNDDRTISIKMSDYIKEVVTNFKEDVSSPVTMLARKDLFEINHEAKMLDDEHREAFHSIVQKLLYVSKRGCIDVQLAVGFLCTHISCSTTQDWGKLKCLLQFLYKTIDDPLILGADTLSRFMTWVDVAYGVHQDMRGHTGGALSLGMGTIMCKFMKQKLNTKSSTEGEVIRASDYLPNMIWAKMFMEAQGHRVEKNEFMQDNQSAIKLERNGHASSGQKTRHVNIQYFFIKETGSRVKELTSSIARQRKCLLTIS